MAPELAFIVLLLALVFAIYCMATDKKKPTTERERPGGVTSTVNPGGLPNGEDARLPNRRKRTSAMTANDDKSMGPVSIIGEIIVVLLGVWMRSKAAQFTGDWPMVLSMGCFLFGGGSIVFGIKKLRGR